MKVNGWPNQPEANMKPDTPEHLKAKGFFQYSDIPNLYVHEAGIVYNSDMRELIYPTSGQYKHINFKGLKMLLHRMVAHVFCEMPEWLDPTKAVVNHLDGNKWNNHRNNLEWTDARGNSVHAQMNGLHPLVKPVLMKDLRTGDIQRFYSLNECARHHGINAAMISLYIHPKNFGKVFKHYYVLIFEGQEWPPTGQEAIGTFKSGQFKECVLIDKDENKTYLVASMVHAAGVIGMKGGTLSWRIRAAASLGQQTCKFDNWEITLRINYTGEIPEDAIVVKALHHNQIKRKGWRKRVRMRTEHLITGEVLEYDDVYKLAEALKFSYVGLFHHLKRNDNVFEGYLKVSKL